MLSGVALGATTERVKKFVIDAYVRGARAGCAEKTDFEGSTSVFTKRRYRDRWNRTLVRRIAKTRSHSLKIKGRVRSRGARANGFFNERRALLARRNSRAQSLFILHIAGDWHPEYETATHAPRPHMMRAMLVSNLAVQERFANGSLNSILGLELRLWHKYPKLSGTQGRLMHWHPEMCERKKVLYSTNAEIVVRFVKESALNKREMLPGLVIAFWECNEARACNQHGLQILTTSTLPRVRRR